MKRLISVLVLLALLFRLVGAGLRVGWTETALQQGLGFFTKMELLILVKGDKNCGSAVSGQMIPLHFA